MKIGVVVARFQGPNLHKGHISLLQRVQEKSDHLVVVLGISPVVCPRDPLPYGVRQKMVFSLFPTATVWGVPNYRHDRDWAAAIDEFLYQTFPRADITLYGCRDSCLEQYKEWGYNKVEQLPETDGTKFCQATQDRAGVKLIHSEDFRRGLIHGVATAVPRVLAAVDVAMYQREPKVVAGDFPTKLRVLLVRKQGEAEWRFPGGCVDANDKSFEEAARREHYEETGLSGGPLVYISSRCVDDWRYRRTGISVFSTFYASEYTFGYPQAQDREIADAKWVIANEHVLDVTLVPEHMPFYHDFLKFAKEKQFL
jgi:8-oxo-dGTP pyrophosphatase MutT (NUDIX family)